ncbi:f-box wd-40 repeat-containing protein [Ophiostoma piceae UAMH 11346]|uniref:F-box wd-40 repeat-containing protein n=1 Tax=Ophiostoma piceae (strain UAMH 11346) TaxID=1262450 RepID=S3CA12_OPHP1|nr:f-box wd-40 repeat-containing protein [Ophiostoma piceae UAMH 11346]
MDPFEPQQPDEGYSEAPLSGSGVLTAKSSGSGVTPLPHILLQHINSLSQSSKIQLVESLLESLPTNVVAQIVQKLSPRLYIDFIRYLPPEICLNILGYLDPLSLIAVARSCRAWYGLALDRQLWEALYYVEGWKTIAPSLRQWEELVNRDRPVASEGSRMSKRRAITSSSRRTVNADRDHVMLDATPEPPSTSPSPLVLPQELSTASTGTSIFGSSAATIVASQQPSFSRDDSQQSVGSSSSRKGKQRASSPPPQAETGSARDDHVATPSDSLAMLTSPMAITNNTLPQSALWAWDTVSERYRLNWKHLYTLRRRLESNWELGKFTNFQFPHPDHPEEAHGECIYTIQFNSDYLVSGSRDRTIRIWNMKTRRLMQRPLSGHRGSVLCLQFDSDPEEDLIVSGSSDSKVILWKFSTGEVIQRLTNAHREPVLNVKFDKKILVTCSKDKTIKIFNRRPLKAGDLGYDSSPGVRSAVNPVPVQLKNYTDGSTLLDQMPIKPAYSMIGILEGHSAAVNAVQIHGREIVSASGDRNVKIWDWPNQSCVRTLIGHSKGIACVQYDGRRIVSGSSDNEVKVFDRTTGLEVASLRAHKNLVRTVQAGFGDLPYSQDEDEKAAARFDAKYREYRQNGLYENSAHTNQRRQARAQAAAESASAIAADDEATPDAATQAAAQAGAAAAAAAAATAAEEDEDFLLRPENIRFTGAKLPPGGGGGHNAVEQDALELTLTAHPELLEAGMSSILQSAIARHPSPFVRSQLQEAVTAARHRAQHGQGVSAGISVGTGGVPPSAIFGPPSSSAGPSSSAAPVATPAALSSNQNILLPDPPAAASPAPTVPLMHTSSTWSKLNSNRRRCRLITITTITVQRRRAVAAGAGGDNGANNPARVFKLQFDARRIICCSQAAVIVGWDFCNGDPELEEASKFFGTIEKKAGTLLAVDESALASRLFDLALGLRRLVDELGHLVLHKTRDARGAGAVELGLELDVLAERLELSVQLGLVDVLGHIVAARQRFLDLVAHVHEVGHLVLHALDLVQVHLAVLLAQLLVRRLHGVDRRHHILEVVLHRLRLLHVPGLRLELIALRLVLLAALQHLERFLLERGLAGPVAHATELGLVGAELGIDGGEFAVEGLDAVVDVAHGMVEGRFRGLVAAAAKEAVHYGNRSCRGAGGGWDSLTSTDCYRVVEEGDVEDGVDVAVEDIERVGVTA